MKLRSRSLLHEPTVLSPSEQRDEELTILDMTRPIIAASLHPSSASATNPNRAKRHGARLPQKDRTTVKRDGLTRSGVTVIRVDPATLARSRAGGRNVSDRVVDSGTVIARNVLSRRTLRKVAGTREPVTCA